MQLTAPSQPAASAVAHAAYMELADVTTRPLAQFTYHAPRGATFTSIARSVANPSASLLADRAAYIKASNAPGRVTIVHGSFDQALESARAFSALADGGSSIPSITGRQAQAIVQARDGAWFVTALGTATPSDIHLDSLDFPGLYVGVRGLDPAVAAIVTADTVIDLRPPTVEPSPRYR